MDQRRQPLREYYNCPPGSNCSSDGLPMASKTLNTLYSPCQDCASIHHASRVRTAYDLYMLQSYNTKAQNSDTDLMRLQFTR